MVFLPPPPPPLPPPPPEPKRPGLPKEFDEELFHPFLSPPKRDEPPPPPPPLPFKGDLELLPNGATNGGGLELPKGDGLFGPRANGAGRLGESNEDLLLKLK